VEISDACCYGVQTLASAYIKNQWNIYSITASEYSSAINFLHWSIKTKLVASPFHDKVK
jgi:hypothetical protein